MHIFETNVIAAKTCQNIINRVDKEWVMQRTLIVGGGEDYCSACLYFNKIGFDQKNKTFVCSEAVEFKLLKL